MTRRRPAALLLFAALLICGCQTAPQTDTVVIHTELGDIRLAIETERAPLTAANFLRYVDAGRYAGGASFYRVVALDNQPDNDVTIEVIQGGLLDGEEGTFPPIAHETTETTGLRHTDGVVSMARLEPGTATSEIFICLGDQPELDFGGRRNPDGQGFAAFGRVVGGMEVVRAIHQRPADGQMLDPPIAIRNIVRD